MRFVYCWFVCTICIESCPVLNDRTYIIILFGHYQLTFARLYYLEENIYLLSNFDLALAWLKVIARNGTESDLKFASSISALLQLT